jgi:hypothetical protein
VALVNAYGPHRQRVLRTFRKKDIHHVTFFLSNSFVLVVAKLLFF